MSNFLGGYMSIYLVCEDRFSYYHLGRTFLGPYATITILLALDILDQATSGWLDIIHIGGHHTKIFLSMCRAH